MAENAAEVLAAIARARASPLTSALGAPGNLRRLVARAVDAPKSPALVQVCLLPSNLAAPVPCSVL